ncbi:hypothetical protein ACIPK7_05395 [Pseudomonas sp. NPDC086581]|uniref:hypothetical protein n=1 Tax=Pseudomonas sp. NPDC086581 TaxID=3364432 RepID=UPI0038258456
MDWVMSMIQWLGQWVQPLPGLPLPATVLDTLVCGGIFYMVAFHYCGSVSNRWLTWMAYLLAVSSGLTALFNAAALGGVPFAARLAYVANGGINCMLFAALVVVRGNVGQLLRRPKPGPKEGGDG